MSWTKPDDSLREQDPMGRFELVCEAYLDANELQRKRMLDALDEKDRKDFLIGCGLYHLFRDQRFYDTVKRAVGEQIWNDAHQAKG